MGKVTPLAFTCDMDCAGGVIGHESQNSHMFAYYQPAESPGDGYEQFMEEYGYSTTARFPFVQPQASIYDQSLADWPQASGKDGSRIEQVSGTEYVEQGYVSGTDTGSFGHDTTGGASLMRCPTVIPWSTYEVLFTIRGFGGTWGQNTATGFFARYTDSDNYLFVTFDASVGDDIILGYKKDGVTKYLLTSQGVYGTSVDPFPYSFYVDQYVFGIRGYDDAGFLSFDHSYNIPSGMPTTNERFYIGLDFNTGVFPDITFLALRYMEATNFSWPTANIAGACSIGATQSIPGLLFYDEFTEATTVELSTHTSDSGHDWLKAGKRDPMSTIQVDGTLDIAELEF